jgi:hypothetical protein
MSTITPHQNHGPDADVRIPWEYDHQIGLIARRRSSLTRSMTATLHWGWGVFGELGRRYVKFWISWLKSPAETQRRHCLRVSFVIAKRMAERTMPIRMEVSCYPSNAHLPI